MSLLSVQSIIFYKDYRHEFGLTKEAVSIEIVGYGWKLREVLKNAGWQHPNQIFGHSLTRVIDRTGTNTDTMGVTKKLLEVRT